MATTSTLLVFVLFFISIVRANNDVPSRFFCTSTSQSKRSIPDESAKIGELTNLTKTTTDSLSHLKDIAYDIRDKSSTNRAVLNNILLLVEELEKYHNKSFDEASPLPNSCLEVKERMPTSPSGIYLIAPNERNTQYVYCYMDTLCGSQGGWTRLINLNMSDIIENCPNELRLYEVNDIRACGRPPSGGGSCQSVNYPSYGVKYSQVCGRARGYQYYSTDAIDIGSGHGDINSFYVDGLSLTRGNPRKHIWTFMSGLKEDNSISGGRYSCPCQNGSQQATSIPTFIEGASDFFCESGNSAEISGYLPAMLYTDDPLWDGKDCRGLEAPCCSDPNLPWFYKPLGMTSTDNIEVRLCSDQATANEDTTIDQLEVYVK